MRLTLIFIGLFVLSLYSHNTMAKIPYPNAVGIKGGWHLMDGGAYKDFYNISTLGFGFVTGELFYHRKVYDHLIVEGAFGYAPFTKTQRSLFASGDVFKHSLQNLYFAPTVKGYYQLKDILVVYGGVGPDFYYTLSGTKYTLPSGTSSDGENFFSIGMHGLAGIDFFIYKNPSEEEFQAPASVFLEYKYTWVKINEADGKALYYAGTNLGLSFSKHSLNVGGHTLMMGLRWHF